MSDPVAIDYQPLQGMRHAYRTVFKASFRSLLGIGAFILLLIILPIIGIGTASFAFVLGGPFLYFMYLSVYANRYKNALWVGFANANGWLLDTATSELELVPPSMQIGHSQAFSPIIQATLGELTSNLFSYKTTIGQGRSAHTYFYTVARVGLPTTLPHLLLLSKKAGAELGRDLADKQDLQLEGDFNDYFKLQIEQGQQIDALTIITPDVMQALVQYSQAEDIEIIGSDLYFILGADRRDPRHVQQLIESVQALASQIIQNMSLETGNQPASVL